MMKQKLRRKHLMKIGIVQTMKINRCHPGKFIMRVKMNNSQKKKPKVKINNILDHVANKRVVYP